MNKTPLHWQILIGIVAGAILGILIPGALPIYTIIGKMFIRSLKMIVVPLIISSLVCGVTNIQGSGGLGRIGGKTLAYYLFTSIVALISGLFLVNVLQPGVGASIELPSNGNLDLNNRPFSETLINIIPENIFSAMSNTDMLAIIFFSILFGVFVTKLNTEKRILLTNIFDAVFDVMMKITLFIIRFAPLGVMGIVASIAVEQSNLFELIVRLGRFAGVVVLGLCLHLFLILPVILLLFAKVNPMKHYNSMFSVLLTAFSTASSNATLPLTMETVEEEAGVSNRIASFTLPLGATINMDGTALYELVVAGFVAQLYGIDLTITKQFILVATALLASIGTAGVPMASYVTMTIIFTAVGLPLEAMLIVMPIDRPLDMIRTATNVFSDTCGAVVIARSEKEKLKY